jgi:Dolichyl-phosphate-mannose-protein mannosyltransferase
MNPEPDSMGTLRGRASSLTSSERGRSALWLALLVCVVAPFYFLPAVRYPFPLGFAGLYALMAQSIADARFALPLHIPYYGPGGIPFAYPPLGPYLMAAFTSLTRQSAFAYMRYAPPLFSLLAFLVTYLLFRRITKSDAASFVTIALVSLSPTVFGYNVTAGGVVRGLAQLVTMGCLYALFRWLQDQPASFPVWPGVLFGLTILTHLTNALFLVVAVPLICLFNLRLRKALDACARVFVVGLVVSAPWWIHVGGGFGPSVFLNAIQSHGTLDVLTRLSVSFVVERALDSLRSMYGLMPVLFTLVVLGLAAAVARRKWFLPVWFLLCLLALTEAERLTIFVGALLAAELLATAFRRLPGERWVMAPAALAIAVLLTYSLVNPVRDILRTVPGISQETMSLATWFHQETREDATFIALGPPPQSEWMPYLLQRTPLIGRWGSEWLGTYDTAAEVGDQAESCYNRQDWPCVEQLLVRAGLEPNYVIVFKPPGSATLEADMASRYPVAFQDSQAVVFIYADAG